MKKKNSNMYNPRIEGEFNINFKFIGKATILQAVALFCIFVFADLKCVDALTDHDANINAEAHTYINDWTSLRRNLETLKDVVNEVGSKTHLNKENVIEEVKNALQKRDSNMFNEWMKKNFDVNFMFLKKITLLHVAAACNFETVKALVYFGANIKAKDNMSALDREVMMEVLGKCKSNEETGTSKQDLMSLRISLETLKEIMDVINNKPNLSKKNVIDEIKNALQKSSSNMYNEWMKDNFNVNFKFHGKFTLLQVAAGFDYSKIVKALVDFGSNIIVRNNISDHNRGKIEL